MNMQPQKSYTYRYLEFYPDEGESNTAHQWYDADNNLVCYAAEKEVHEVARFFGYTPEQFDALRAKIQAGMVNDHRRQMKEKEFAREVLFEGAEYGDKSNDVTFKEAFIATVAIASVAGIIIYFFG